MILSLAAFFILANSTAFSVAFDWASFSTFSIPSRLVAWFILVSKSVFSLGYKLSNEPITFLASVRAALTSNAGSCFCLNRWSLATIPKLRSRPVRLMSNSSFPVKTSLAPYLHKLKLTPDLRSSGRTSLWLL